MHLNPIAISAIIVAAVAFFGAFVAYFRDRKVYHGHGEYAADARALAKKLNGEIFRDGEDLVINGTQGRLSVVIRLSYAENTPGLHIRMVAPSNFRVIVVPKGAQTTEGRTQIRTGDESFDVRFVTRTDQPTEAKMFLGSKGVLPEVSKLGCSAKGFITFSVGNIELSEALVPVPSTGAHIQDHLQSMERLAGALERMPFADRVELKPLKRERRLALKAAIVVGIVAALVGIITAAKQQDVPVPTTDSQTSVGEGILPNDAILMGSTIDWRTAGFGDLDPDAGAWARLAGQRDVGRLTCALRGTAKTETDVAYLLVNEKDGQRRVVMLVDGKDRYDVKYPYVGLLAVIPKVNLARIQWSSRAPEKPDGDALLIVRKPQDRASGLVLYFSDGKLVSGIPSDYQSINLLE